MPECRWRSKITSFMGNSKKNKKPTNILTIRQGKYLGLMAPCQVSGYITSVYETAVCLHVMRQVCLYFFRWTEWRKNNRRNPYCCTWCASCWSISAGASRSRPTPWTWSTADSGSLRAQRGNRERELELFHSCVRILTWSDVTSHLHAHTGTLVCCKHSVTIWLPNLLRFSALQLHLHTYGTTTFLVVYYLIICPIYFWPPYLAAHINGSSCVWPDRHRA